MQNTATMILEEDQRSWFKIECARVRNARQYYEGLQEACGERALPYHTVARWVKAFKEGRHAWSYAMRIPVYACHKLQ